MTAGVLQHAFDCVDSVDMFAIRSLEMLNGSLLQCPVAVYVGVSRGKAIEARTGVD